MTKIVTESYIRDLGYQILEKVGASESIINPVVDGLVWTSLRGIDSHGIRLLPHYVKAVIAGRLNVSPNMVFEQQSIATGCLDADHTFGHAAGVFAMQRAIDIAEKSGIAAVAVRNSSHCGALSYFAHAAAEKNMLGIACTHATPRVKTPGSTRPFFGNNPLCIVAPMNGEPPFCFDSATTSTTFNAVKAAAAAGISLSPGLVADRDGEETIDPSKAHQLLPIGGYKGFGLSMAVDIFCALMTGMPNGNNVSQMFSEDLAEKRFLGQFYCAINIESFRNINDFKAELKDLAERLRSEPNDGLGTKQVMMPGDPEKKAWKTRSTEGIPLADNVYNSLVELLD